MPEQPLRTHRKHQEHAPGLRQMGMGVQAHPPAAAAPRQGPTEMSDAPCRLLSMDWKIELVAIPVTDVDRAKEFYVERVGFHADHLVFRTFVAWARVRAEGRKWPVLGPT
jgi:hypothetical protein